jgi:hypothetical protein
MVSAIDDRPVSSIGPMALASSWICTAYFRLGAKASRPGKKYDGRFDGIF